MQLRTTLCIIAENGQNTMTTDCNVVFNPKMSLYFTAHADRMQELLKFTPSHYPATEAFYGQVQRAISAVA